MLRNNNIFPPFGTSQQQTMQRQQHQPSPKHYFRMRPEFLIQTVTAAKILQEQQEAAQATPAPFGFGMQRVRPEQLIQSVTETKIAQKRTADKLLAEKKRAERAKQAQRTVAPLDFSTLSEDTVLKLVDIMAALPAAYGEEFRYGELVKPVSLPPEGDGRYSKEQILIVGAQLEMAKFRAQQKAAEEKTKTTTVQEQQPGKEAEEDSSKEDGDREH